MLTNYLLVDYENVQPQPEEFSLLREKNFHVKLFLGPHPPKFSIPLLLALQSLDGSVEYIQVETQGKNAVDFQIAYQLGVLSCEAKNAFFHILSKDNDYAPLIASLSKQKLKVQRWTSIGEIPCLKTPAPATRKDNLTIAVEDLRRRNGSKPKSQKTHFSTLCAVFRKTLNEQQVNELINTLRRQGFIKVEGTKISYHLPPEEGQGASRRTLPSSPTC